MNGFAFQNSLMPNGDGTHAMMVSKALQAGAKAAAGDLVSVTLAGDRSERVVIIPPELEKALCANKAAAAAFERLSYSHRKEFAEWIASAKRQETRVSRAEKSIDRVITKQHVRFKSRLLQSVEIIAPKTAPSAHLGQIVERVSQRLPPQAA
jgi:hypothetical protein